MKIKSTPVSIMNEQQSSQIQKSGLAIASLVLGILAFIPLVGALLGVLSVVFGIVAKRQMKAQLLKGNGLATAGIILGIVGIVVTFCFYGALYYFGFKSQGGPFKEAKIEATKQMLTQNAGALELYKKQYDKYPESLDAAKQAGFTIFHIDFYQKPLQYTVTSEGQLYILRSAGQDGVFETNDDVSLASARSPLSSSDGEQTSQSPDGEDIALMDVTDWQVYQNDTLDFKVKYPQGWEVLNNDPSNTHVTISLRDKQYNELVEWPGFSFADTIGGMSGFYEDKYFSEKYQNDGVIRIGFEQGGKKWYARCALLDNPKEIPNFAATMIQTCNTIISTFQIISPKSTFSADVTQWATYQNDTLGFEVKHPHDWNAQGPYPIFFNNTQGSEVKLAPSGPSHVSGVAIEVFDLQQNESFVQAFKRIYRVDTSGIKKSQMQVNGIMAEYYQDMPGMASFDEVFLVYAQRLYGIRFFERNDTVNAVVSSFTLR